MEKEDIMNCTIEYLQERIAAVCKERDALKRELIDERDRFDRLSDFEVAESKELAAAKALHGNCHVCNNYTPYHNQGKCRFCCYEICRAPDCEANDNWEWRGPQKET